MKPSQTLLFAVALSITLLSASGAAQAALIDRGGGLIYDTDLNVTWLSDANYAKTSGYDADGLMTWSQATTWAANLSYYDSVRNVTYTDWRLPGTTDTGTPGCDHSYNGTDCGYNSTGSEMAHLYYNSLDNKAPCNPAISTATSCIWQSGDGLVNDPANPNDESLFTNFQSYAYWSGTEYAISTSNAWYFGFGGGDQGYVVKTYNLYALAVHPGDVAAVPVPAAAWLLGSGLLGLIGVGKRRLALR
jgi:hypothetical protein